MRDGEEVADGGSGGRRGGSESAERGLRMGQGAEGAAAEAVGGGVEMMPPESSC